MLPAALTHGILRSLDWLAGRTLPPEQAPPHQITGRRGEEDAYFHLRRLVTSWWRATSARPSIEVRST
jgi:hypothetical protein